MNNINIKISLFLYSIFSIMCFVIPTGLNEIKIVLFLLSFFLIVVENGIFKIKLNYLEIIRINLFLIIGVFYFLLGIKNNNPGAIPSLKVIIFYPILYGSFYFYLRKLFSKVDIKKIIFNIYYISLFLIIIDIILFILYSFGIINFYFKFPKNVYGINKNGFVINEISLKSLGSLLFLIPFFIFDVIINKKFKIFYVMLSILIGLITGRTALQIVILLSLVIIIFNYLKKKNILCKIVIIFIVGGIIFYKMDFFYSLFNIIENKLLSSERNLQIKYLLEAFFKKPIFGHGIGATLENGFRRSVEQSWAYEYSYLVYLFEFGLIGFIYYMWLLLSPIYYSIKLKYKSLYCVILGWAMFLIGNASNPYLLKLDYLNLYLTIIILVNFQKYSKNKKM